MANIFHITGPPGTGKTFHLAARAAQAIDKRGSHRVAVCSLTRAAAREIGGRGLDIPEGQLGTLHSFCFQAAGSPEIADRKIKEWNETHPDDKLPTSRTTPPQGGEEGGFAGFILVFLYFVIFRAYL